MYQALINFLRYKNHCNNFRIEVKKKETRCQLKRESVHQPVKPRLAGVAGRTAFGIWIQVFI